MQLKLTSQVSESDQSGPDRPTTANTHAPRGAHEGKAPPPRRTPTLGQVAQYLPPTRPPRGIFGGAPSTASGYSNAHDLEAEAAGRAAASGYFYPAPDMPAVPKSPPFKAAPVPKHA